MGKPKTRLQIDPRALALRLLGGTDLAQAFLADAGVFVGLVTAGQGVGVWTRAGLEEDEAVQKQFLRTLETVLQPGQERLLRAFEPVVLNKHALSRFELLRGFKVTPPVGARKQLPRGMPGVASVGPPWSGSVEDIADLARGLRDRRAALLLEPWGRHGVILAAFSSPKSTWFRSLPRTGKRK